MRSFLSPDSVLSFALLPCQQSGRQDEAWGQLAEGHTWPVLRHSAHCLSADTSLPAELWGLPGHLHPGGSKSGKLEVSVLEGIERFFGYKALSENRENTPALHASASQ